MKKVTAETRRLLIHSSNSESEEGRSESEDSHEDADDATAKERALTAILRKLAYEDFSALEKAALNEEDNCSCESCKERSNTVCLCCSRAWTNETLEELKLIQSYWLELRQYLRIIYRLGMKGSIKSIDENYHTYMKDLVSRLCDVCNPHQLYQRLEGQVREFVIEVKMRLLQLMDKLADNPQLPNLFISGMLDRYNKMMYAAQEIAPVLSQLEAEHLSKFNLTWKMLNQRLFQTSIYTDPFFKNSVPLFITQLGKNTDSDENKILVREFLTFDDEITLVEGMWKDVESKIHQYTQDHAMMTRQRFLKEEYLNDLKALRRLRLKLCNNNKLAHETKEISQETVVREIDGESDGLSSLLTGDGCECHVCLDASAHSPVELMDQVVSPNLHSGGFHLYPHIHGTGGGEIYTEALNLTQSISADEKQGSRNFSGRGKPTINTQASITKQPQTQKRVDKATQKDHEVFSSEPMSKPLERKQAVNTGQRNLKDVSTEPTHHPHACLKHSDTIKRIPCSEHDDDGSTCNNHEDSHSDSSQPDPRHCDCCYCEVFGHGIPTTAPMSRNYQEMRERLRLLLNKKKSKCKSNSGSPQPPQNTQKKPTQQQKENVSKSQSMGDTRDLEDLLDYIEGTEVKCRNEKRAAKKARQREKKQILLDLKQREEDEKERKRKEALAIKQKQNTSFYINTTDQKSGSNKCNKKGKNNLKQQDFPTKIQTNPGTQMVTIKRVTEPYNSEPTVTITLRGATPNQDKVLYTLLNGQVCKVKESKGKPEKNNTMAKTKTVPQKIQISEPPVVTKKVKTKKDTTKEEINNTFKVTPNESLSQHSSIQISNGLNNLSKGNSKPFSLDDIKLPPGITITKVDPSTIQAKNLIQERLPNKYNAPAPMRSPPASEVIVVATGKLKESCQSTPVKETVCQNGSANGKKKKNQTQKKTDQLNEMVSMYQTLRNLPNNNNTKKKKNKKKSENNTPILNKTTMYPGIDIEPIDMPKEPMVKAQSLTVVTQPSVSIRPTVFNDLVNTPKQLSISNPQYIEQGKKKKKKSKKAPLNNVINPEEWSLLDSVFAPKDIDLDDGDMDDAERELEAFKRFCFQSVPPKQKEKVHLNIKDIVLKKKSSVISCS